MASHPGPDWRSFLASMFLIAAPSGIFLGMVAPELGQHISWSVVAISAVLVAISLTMLLCTALRDPGFIPRSPYVEETRCVIGIHVATHPDHVRNQPQQPPHDVRLPDQRLHSDSQVVHNMQPLPPTTVLALRRVRFVRRQV